MSSDVEMLEPPPPSKSPKIMPETQQDSIMAASEVDSGLSSPPAPPDSSPSTTPTQERSKPLSTASASIKPKSTKASRPRSPSPSPPPRVIPLQTIRLEVRLGGPSNYSVDVSTLAKETGQRPPTPVNNKRDTSESENEEQQSVSTAKRKKKRHVEEYYDVNDPFIDDSELALDNRTYFAQTKQAGFYVSSGEVALARDKSSPKKPKSTRPSLLGPLSLKQSQSLPIPSTKQEDAGKSSPISFSDAEGDPALPVSHLSTTLTDGDSASANTLKRKRQYITTVDPQGKRRRVVDPDSFHPELAAMIAKLKDAKDTEAWEKGRFPPNLKPLLVETALKAIQLEEYDEDFFALMPTIFPYNKFTMTKLIKRSVFADHIALLKKAEEETLAELKAETEAGLSKAEASWERTMQQWHARQARGGHAEDGSNPGELDPEHDGSDIENVEHDVPANASAATDGALSGAAKRAINPPQRKYRQTETMKEKVFRLVRITNECVRLENEKNALEKNSTQVSEQGARKILYQKIVAAFPPGWMNSGQISRDVSVMKKKFEKEDEP